MRCWLSDRGWSKCVEIARFHAGVVDLTPAFLAMAHRPSSPSTDNAPIPFYSSLTPGANGFPPVIPPKANLIFDVELVAIKNRKAPKGEL